MNSMSLPIGIKFEYVKDEHTLLELTPDSTIDSVQCSHELLTAIHSVNKDFKTRFKRDGRVWTYYRKDVVSYEIYLEKEKIKFTIAVPTRYDSFIENKVNQSWKKTQIKKADEDYLQVFENNNSLTCDMKLEKHYFMSLLTDNRTNGALDSILGVSRNLQEDDKLLFQLMLEPIDNWWHYFAEEKYEDYRNGKEVDNNKGFIAKVFTWIYENIVVDLVDVIDTTISTIFDVPDDSRERDRFIENTRSPRRRMSAERDIDMKKTAFQGFNTTIRLFSYSKNEVRRNENLNSLIVALRTLDADNNLVPGKFKKPIKIRRSNGTISVLYPKNILNFKEVQQIVTLPNRSMQKEYKQINSIAHKQTELPNAAFSGKGVPIGTIKAAGVEQEIRLSDKLDDKCQSKILITRQGGGKTTTEQNYIYQSYLKNEPVIVIDYVKDCELTKEIEPYFDPKRLKIYDMNEYTSGMIVGGLGYNEVYDMLDSDNPRTILNGANYMATQLSKLLNHVTLGDTSELSSQMTKYLSSACRVVFSKKGATIMDVAYVLENPNVRETWIKDAIERGIFTEDHIDIRNLRYLTVEDKNGNLSNRDADIKGILNRFAGIQSLDLRLIELFSNPIDVTIDFRKHIENKDVVFIRIPQTMFPEEQVRDIITSFFCTKLWLTVQVMNNQTPTHLILDEIKMVPITSYFLSNYITQFRRYRLSTMFAAHNLDQFKHALTDINSSGANLFILQGVKRDAIKIIESDLQSFSWSDIQQLKPFHALCVTTYNNEQYEFVTNLYDAFFKDKKFIKEFNKGVSL